jgi:hypothetical protein
MGALELLWRLLSADELSKLGDDLAKLQHDGSQIATDFQVWMQQGIKIAQDIKKGEADATPIIKMLQQLKK